MNTMTDKEMLAAAAKAAGIRWSSAYRSWVVDLNSIESTPWRPLTDDGDALRLAAKLKLDLCWNQNDGPGIWHFNAWPQDGGMGQEEPLSDEPAKAMRRAIVRAAAATVDA